MELSAPKLHIPMLNGLMLGDAISSHDGVYCYPALSHSNQDKYILKIISVPPSQAQLDALLLAGAFPSKESAMEYYMDVCRDMLREAEILKHLSAKEGFIPYLDSQIVSSEQLDGHDVYLLSNFRQSVAQIFASRSMTHRQIVRMALDMCEALVNCRREGYLYVDLKPENIYYSEELGYRIGDIGFAALASLAYSSLPDKYRSAYTAPELMHEMAVLNDTVDIYALGLILYQAYNGGTLSDAPDGNRPAPLYADETLGNIIAKACHTDPAQRWKDPMEFAQTIVAYAQANPPADIPIVPELPEKPLEDISVEEVFPEVQPEDLQTPSIMALPEEITDMLAQADDLIAHELPEPPVAPEPIDVPMPERIYLDPEPEEQPNPQPEAEPKIKIEQEDVPAPSEQLPREENIVITQKTSKPECYHRQLPWRHLANILAIAALLSLLYGLYYFRQNYYLQNIQDLVLDYKGDTVSVSVVTDIDPALLTVVCSDSYGNTQRQNLVGGIALFHSLNPQTHYTVRLEISGWHKLIGATSDSFTTDPQTHISLITAQIGSQDGSVILSFQTNGAENNNWILSFGDKRITFQGNIVEVSGLIVGQTYDFRLSRADGQAISGQTSIPFTARAITLAQNARILTWDGENLCINWEAPEGADHTLWQVHCYNQNGYSRTITTEQLSATFANMDRTMAYTAEITAMDMPQSVILSIPANPVHLGELQISHTQEGMLTIQWQYEGTVQEGWTLTYTIDGQLQPELHLSDNKASIIRIPGASYTFRVAAIDAGIQYGGDYSYDCPEAETFQQWGISADELDSTLFLQPDNDHWTVEDISEDLYSDRFTMLQEAAILLKTHGVVEESSASVIIRFLVRDSDGNPVSYNNQQINWLALWQDGICILQIPQLPELAGEYTIDVFFNEQLIGHWIFSMVESE